MDDYESVIIDLEQARKQFDRLKIDTAPVTLSKSRDGFSSRLNELIDKSFLCIPDLNHGRALKVSEIIGEPENFVEQYLRNDTLPEYATIIRLSYLCSVYMPFEADPYDLVTWLISGVDTSSKKNLQSQMDEAFKSIVHEKTAIAAVRNILEELSLDQDSLDMKDIIIKTTSYLKLHKIDSIEEQSWNKIRTVITLMLRADQYQI